VGIILLINSPSPIFFLVYKIVYWHRQSIVSTKGNFFDVDGKKNRNKKGSSDLPFIPMKYIRSQNQLSNELTGFPSPTFPLYFYKKMALCIRVADQKG
jgi:hypothetical protein